MAKLWTKEVIRRRALEYTNVMEFKAACPGAYRRACAEGFLKSVTEHMPRKPTRKPVKITLETAKAVALKYQTRQEFRVRDHSVYITCCRKKWLETVCAHMPRRNRWAGV